MEVSEVDLRRQCRLYFNQLDAWPDGLSGHDAKDLQLLELITLRLDSILIQHVQETVAGDSLAYPQISILNQYFNFAAFGHFRGKAFDEYS